MTQDLDETLSALLDGDVAPTEHLRRALMQPDAVSTMLAILDVRDALVTTTAPGDAAVERVRAAVNKGAPRRIAVALRWVAAVVVLLAIGTTLGVAIARRDLVPEMRPPAADLVASFAFDG